jgi:hypothetical protein
MVPLARPPVLDAGSSNEGGLTSDVRLVERNVTLPPSVDTSATQGSPPSPLAHLGRTDVCGSRHRREGRPRPLVMAKLC